VTISITVWPERQELEIIVSDDGIGMTPRKDSPGIGAGLPLIRRLAYRMDHRLPARGGTELWMCFRFGVDDGARGKREPAP
jgi:anti-sigma regulatory factor (Ser/Thr protein kinase)